MAMKKRYVKTPTPSRRYLTVDRLSDLPEGILCHILSFLPTKFSAATSVLARRWRFLWNGVPVLDFDDRYHDSTTTRFSDIIDRVMLLHKVRNLDTFRLSCENDDHCGDYEVQTWITGAIDRSVKNIVLYPSPKVTLLSRCLFNCKTLVDLRLYRCRCLDLTMAGSVCLPSLKKLHLYSVMYIADECLTNLVSGCLVLEELVINRILKKDLVCCRVSSPTLKRLAVNFQFDDLGSPYDEHHLDEYNGDEHNDDEEDSDEDNGDEENDDEEDGDEDNDDDEDDGDNDNVDEEDGDEDSGDEHNNDEYRLEINAPALRYLKVEDWLSKNISIHKLNSLIEADIHYNNPTAVDFLDYITYVFNFLAGVSNVDWLKLTCVSNKFENRTLKSGSSCASLSFDNLTKFEVAAKCLDLTSFLEKAPNLEVLIIHQVDADQGNYWSDAYPVPRCLKSYLRSVIYYQFSCAENEDDKVYNRAYEFSLIEYLLRNSLVLKKMEIHSKHGVDLKAKFNALQRISRFERGSKACNVAFC